MTTIDLAAQPGGGYAVEVERTCGNCRHRSRKLGKCRHVGSVCAGYEVGKDHPACAWHRLRSERKPLPAPDQLMRAEDGFGRILACNVPRGMENRRGWTEAAAARAGVRVIEAPRKVRVLGYREA